MNEQKEENVSRTQSIEFRYKDSATSENDADIGNIVVSEGADEICADFVRSMPGARLCHLPEWTQMVENVFGHQGHYLIAHENNVICGVLPLSYMRSRMFGNRLISQPFSDYGGPLTHNSAALKALYNRAIEIAKYYGCMSIELRNTKAMPFDMYLRTDKVCMLLPLAFDPEVVWKGLRPQIRNRIRQAEKAGITVTGGGHELLNDFYNLWTIRMRDLGTPCYSRKLFSSILEKFPDQSRIFLARYQGKVAAAFFTYAFNGCAHTRWGAAMREYDSLSPNYILNWSAIEYYCQIGMKSYDFGRSTAKSSQYTFKKRWGAQPLQLNWQYWTRPGHELFLPQQDSVEYKKKVELWKKLPLWMTRLIGPHISRSLP